LDEVAPTSAQDSECKHDAGFGALDTERGRLPLRAMDITGRIDGLLSQVTVRQTFVNATDEPLEATYIFPLPDRSAVTDFHMQVADRVIEGVLQERGQARREYDEALRQGHRASIAEEERPGVFTLRVGNLMPGDVATVQLTISGVLPYRDGEVTFRFPLVVAPRYIPGIPLSGPSVGAGTAVDTDAAPDASRISPPVLLPGFPNPVQLSLTIDLYEPADDLRVSLFTVWGEEQGGVRRLTLRPGERLDRDFILRFRLGGDFLRSSLSVHPDAGESNEGTFALTIVPPAGSVGGAFVERPRDVVLVLDRSGSMEGWKIVAARRAMASMVDTLNESDRFAVLAFDHRIDAPSFGNEGLGLIPATNHNRFNAVEFLSRLESRGGTEIAEPLDRAVRLLAARGRDRKLQRDRILVLVTDGQVGNEDQVLKSIGQLLSGIRFFALGIDQAVNEGFLHRLAELGAGGSACELVESQARLDAVLGSIHRRIGTPIASDVRLEPTGGQFEILADASVPARPPCLFAGSPLLLLGRYRGCAAAPVELRGESAGGAAWREMVAPNVRDNPAIVSAWARGQVRQLEDRYGARLGDRAALERLIIATSLRFGVLCRFTAYVAVDRSAVVNEGGEVHRITQPVEKPRGWLRSASPTLAYMAPESTIEDSLCLTQAFGGGRAERVLRLEDMGLAMHRQPSAGRALRHARGATPPPPEPLSEELACRGWLAPPDEVVHQAGFQVLKEIAQDDHSTVYQADDRRRGLVIVTMLKKPVNVGGSLAFAKLQKELKGLKHPAIVPIIQLVGDFRSGLVLGVVSEHVKGPTLTEWISRLGLPDPDAAARLVLLLAEALEYGGRQVMVHGNLTPANILIGDDGKPRITGFGLSRLDCGPDTSSPTDRVYLAPELLQSQGAQPTAQTDVYSLGAVFYRLLTGVLAEPDPRSNQLRSPRQVNSQVPADLEPICLKAMAADPSARYATAGEFAADLRRVLGIKRPGLLGRITGMPKPTCGGPTQTPEPRKDFWK
jgi:Ca-activated chloride channel family protein